MKFPHLNLLFFIALLVMSSCQREGVAMPGPVPTQGPSIDMRCCDDAVIDMTEDPRFLDFYNTFINGVFDPTFAILDQFDIEELSAEITSFNTCIDSGNSFDYCIEQSDPLTKLLAIINGFDMDLLLTLRNEFDYLDQNDFNSVIVEAVNQTAQDSGHNLPCFLQFRTDMIDAFTVTGATSLISGVGGGIALVFGIIRARINFCNCLYTNYGAQC